MIYDSIIVTGSAQVSGSLSVTGGITGSLQGTASFATTASYVANASSFPFTGSAIITGSLGVTGSLNVTNGITGSLQGTSSYALTASFVANASSFPFTGSAIITGSLVVTGSTTSTGGFTGSLFGTASFAATASYIQALNTYVTASRTLTINGESYDLTADRSWTIPLSGSVRNIQKFTATSNQTSFTISGGYVTGLVDVYVNGVKLDKSGDFTATNGTTVVLTVGAMLNDIVEVYNYVSAFTANNTLRVVTPFTATASQTTFTVAYTPGFVDVFYNGSKLAASEFTATNGTTIVLGTAAQLNDIIEVIAYSYTVGAFTGIGGSGTANYVAKFTSGSTIATSSIYDSGSNVGINTINPIYTLDVSGSARFTNSATITGSLNISGSNTLIGTKTITGSVFISGSKTIIGTNTITGSLNVSGSITSTGILTAQTLVVQTITSSVLYSSGSNIFGNSLANTQTFTGSVSITGSLTLNNIAIPTSASLASTYLQLAGGTLTGDLSIAYTTANLRLFLNNTTATTGRSWYLNSYSNGSLYVGNATAGDIFNFSSTGAATFSGALTGSSATFSSNVGIGGATISSMTAVSGIELVQGSQIASRILANVPQLYISSNVAGDSYAPTYKVNGYATQYRLQGYDGTHVFYTAPSGTAGNAITFTGSLTITPTGNVGIGTTSPVSPLHQVAGGGAYTGEARFGGSDSSFGLLLNYSQAGATSGSIYCSPGYSNASILFKLGAGSGNTNQLVLTGGGNVGINTTSPLSKLDISVGNQTSLGLFSASGTSITSAGGSTGNLYQISFGYGGGTYGSSTIAGLTESSTGYNTGALIFATRTLTTDTAPGERMRITAAGKIGMGVSMTTPEAQVTIGVSSVSTVGALASAGLAINTNDNNTAVGNLAQISFGLQNVYTPAYIGYVVTTATAYTYGDLIFGTRGGNTDVAPSERMRITSGGRVGIGTTTINSEMLTINQTTGNASALYVYTTGVTTGQSYGLTVAAGTNNSDRSFAVYSQSSSEYFKVRGDGNIFALGIYNNTSSSGTQVNVDSSGNLFRFTSSLRYKRDIVSYTNGLTELLKIEPKFYKSKNTKEGEKVFAGLIAEQIDEIGLTEFVEYNDEGQPDAVHYSAMTALLGKAIQELKAENDTLKDILQRNNII